MNEKTDLLLDGLNTLCRSRSAGGIAEDVVIASLREAILTIAGAIAYESCEILDDAADTIADLSAVVTALSDAVRDSILTKSDSNNKADITLMINSANNCIDDARVALEIVESAVAAIAATVAAEDCVRTTRSY